MLNFTISAGNHQLPSLAVGGLFLLLGICLFIRWLMSSLQLKRPPFRRGMLLLFAFSIYCLVRGAVFSYLAYSKSITSYSLIAPTAVYVLVMSLLIHLWSTYYQMLCIVQNHSSGRSSRIFFSLMIVVLVLLSIALAGVAAWSYATNDDSTVDVVDSALDCAACCVIGFSLCCLSVLLVRVVMNSPIPATRANSSTLIVASSYSSGGGGGGSSILSSLLCCCCCCCRSASDYSPSHRRVELNAVWSAFLLGVYSTLRGLTLIFFSLLQSSGKQFRSDESTGWWALPAFYMVEIVTIVLCVLLLLETPTHTEVKTSYHPQLIFASSREIVTPRNSRPQSSKETTPRNQQQRDSSSRTPRGILRKGSLPPSADAVGAVGAGGLRGGSGCRLDDGLGPNSNATITEPSIHDELSVNVTSSAA